MSSKKRLWMLGLVFLALFGAWSLRPEHMPFTKTAASLVPTESLEIPPLDSDLLFRPPSAPPRVYPYSVIPGGIASVEELKKIIDHEPDIARHLEDFNLQKAKLVRVAQPRSVYVSYRKGDLFFWTTKRLTLAKGELLISDGTHTLRGRCGNDISDDPGEPTSLSEPTIKELETPLLVSEVTPQPGSMPPLIPDSLPPDISLNGGLPTIPPAPLLDPTPPTNSVPPFIYPLIFPAGNNGATPPTPPTPIPEPSTLLLVSLGAAEIGAKRIWEKRKYFKRRIAS